MALPPGFLDEIRARVSIADVVGRRVSWDRRKSQPNRGDWWACCPFHQEKSPSFHVDDRKGFYHCFGCGASGDAFKFLTETEHMGFMEAVEVLAREAGLTMPDADPRAQARARAQAGLAEVLETANTFFRQSLSAAPSRAARAYLDRRGLSEATRDRFGLGYAPPGRRALLEHLAARGIPAAQAVEAGLAKIPEDGGTPYDLFRDRVMFPIRDPRGRCIGFGGRAMARGALAKYLNSPETPLFDKSRVLFNYGPARAAAGKDAALIVAEGYMDVIALVSAGFEGAVAPLGTAVTPEQLELLWKAAPDPLCALDGDAAGLRAARRLAHLALPRLTPGRTLRFAILPEGQDPDDLIRSGGPPAMAAIVERARPLVDILWDAAIEGRDFATPDACAALEAQIETLAHQITDKTVRGHYRRNLRDRLWELTRTARGPAGRRPGARSAQGRVAAKPSAAAAALAGAPAGLDRTMREQAIVAFCLTTPAVLERAAERLADLAFADPDCDAIRAALLDWHRAPRGQVHDAVAARVGEERVEKLLGAPHIAVNAAVRRAGEAGFVALAVTEELDKLSGQHGLEVEMRESSEDAEAPAGDDGARLAWRIAQAVDARHRAARRGGEDTTEFDVLDNGARVPKSERHALAQLLDEIAPGSGSATRQPDQPD